MSKCDGVGFCVCVGGGQLPRISRHSHGTVELQWFRPRSLPWVFQVFGYSVDFNNSSVIDLSSEYSYFPKMVAVIGGGVVGGLGAFIPQIPPLPPISSHPPHVKGKINMIDGVSTTLHTKYNCHCLVSRRISLSRRFTNNNYKNMKIVLHSRSSTFRSTRKIFFTYGIQYRFKAQFLNSIYLIGKISKLSLCTKLKTDAAFPPYILNLTTFQISACYCFNQRFQLGDTRYKSPVQVTPPSHVLQASVAVDV